MNKETEYFIELAQQIDHEQKKIVFDALIKRCSFDVHNVSYLIKP